MPLKLVSIKPKYGSPLTLGQFTVLVGPNNCGKSQTLRDIRSYVTSGTMTGSKLLADVQLTLPSESDAQKTVQFRPHSNPNHDRILGVSSDLQNRHEFTPPKGWLAQQYANAKSGDRSQLLANMGTYWIAHLDAESRFRLTASTESYDTRNEAPQNALQAFFDGGQTAVASLRSAFQKAFAVDIALDWAGMRRWYLKVGGDFGEIPDGLRDLDKLLRDAEELGNQGDGFKSFAGVALALLTFPNRVLLLDEPEAFLHPAQARELGRWVGTAVKGRPTQVVIASHSADFLWGIISASSDATVVRLNRNENKTTFHAVPPETTTALVQSPLLSSQPVLDALFHRGVAVCEGDPDRAVYQTVAHTLLSTRGSEGVLFIHSNGKDAVKKPIELLRRAGVPVCAIVDFDVLNSEALLSEIVASLSETVLSARMIELRNRLATRINELTDEQLVAALRAAVVSWQGAEQLDFRRARRSLKQIAGIGSKWDQVKNNGIEYFDGTPRTEVQELLTTLQLEGLFVVPGGQLESWIKLGRPKGSIWNRAALETLHEGYCPIQLGQFVNSVVKYLIAGKGRA